MFSRDVLLLEDRALYRSGNFCFWRCHFLVCGSCLLVLFSPVMFDCRLFGPPSAYLLAILLRFSGRNVFALFLYTVCISGRAYESVRDYMRHVC